MRLNFSGARYALIANILADRSQEECIYQNLHSTPEAFMLLIRGLKGDELDNLCEYLKVQFPDQDCYMLTQGQGEFYKNNENFVRIIIFNCALQCLRAGRTMGSRVEGNYNTTAWINHSLYEAELAGEFAKELGLNPKIAQTLGILHDIGRKRTHGFNHVITGFELLVDERWLREAPITLTHSFIYGGKREGDFNPEEPEFNIDEQGMPKWDKTAEVDDVAAFIRNYKYDDYDRIINIADLMAFPTGIKSPLDRINELENRRDPDPKTRAFYLAEYINRLSDWLIRFGYMDECEYANIDDGVPELTERFRIVSTEFFNYYTKSIKGKSLEDEGR